MSEEQRQSLKLLEPRSFGACKNATVPMIVMLGYLEVYMKVSDAGMKTTDSNDYRKILRDNRDTNGMLAVT